MKKMTLKMWLLGGFVAIASLCATSCAEGVESEPFSPGVTNAQLESPAADSFSVSLVGSGENEQMKVSWTVVMGAGGYLCYAADVTDENNPVVVFEPKVIDGTSFQFPVSEDHTYLYSVKTLGNEQYNNTDAAEATGVRYFHGIVGEPIPAGSDIGAFIADHLAANAEAFDAARKENFNWELAFDLEAGAEYTMATSVDFGLIPARIRTLNPERPAIINYAAGGEIVTQAGLRLQNLRIDALNADHQALICLSPAPSEEIFCGNLAYMGGTTLWKDLGLNTGKKHSIIEKPIELKNVWVKDLQQPIFNSYKDNVTTNYGVCTLRFINSIVQFKGTPKLPAIYMRKGNNQIMDLTFENTTMFSIDKWNLQFLAGNGQTAKNIFGSMGNNAKWTVKNFTLVLPDNSKQLADNNRNAPPAEITDCIFYNTKQLIRDGNGFNSKSTIVNSTVYNPAAGFDSSNYDEDVKNNGAEAPIDPGFEQYQQSLDFSQPNGGVNFTPTGNALAGRRGDARWLPAVAE